MTYPTYMTADNGLAATKPNESMKKVLESVPAPSFVTSKSLRDQSSKSVALLEMGLSLASESGLKRTRSMIGSFNLDDILKGKTSQDSPATKALNARLVHPPLLNSNVTMGKQESRPFFVHREERMIPEKSLKRSRSLAGAFKLDDLLKATGPVEDSIAFPTIEWSFGEDDNEDNNKDVTCRPDFPPPDPFGCSNALSSLKRFEEDEEDEFECSHRAKRICRGLVRSKKIQTDLASLANLSA